MARGGSEETAWHGTGSSTSASRTVQFARPNINRIIGTPSNFSVFPVVAVTEAPVRLDHVGPLLSYHDDGSVGVPGHDGGHDGGVNNSQSWYTVHLEGMLSININIYDIIVQ